MKKLLFLLLFVNCNGKLSEPNVANVMVTMQRVERIEIMDNLWITSKSLWGHLESNDVSVENMVVNWWSNMYWHKKDSTGYFKTLCKDCKSGVWYDKDGTTDTMSILCFDSLEWVTNRTSIVDSLGYFYNTLKPVRTMQGHNDMGSFMKLYWTIKDVVVDSQEIFLMD
tara:strand:+ start:356 stop:859 length:504 start_codon:yes stop_codon:yes gene_type:complete